MSGTTVTRRGATGLGTTDGYEPPRSGVAPISGVQKRLEDAIGGVALVYAPAGYGKTTQVSLWAARDTRPVLWADLGQADNDPQGLASRLSSMLEVVTPLDSGMGAPHPVGAHLLMVVPAVTEVFRRVDRPVVLVLDDVHLIDDSTTLDVLGAVVNNVPVGSTIVLVGRNDPGVSLGRLWVEDRVEEVSAADLALSAHDARAIFDAVGVEIDDARLDGCVRDTHGWPVGLRLAALALRDGGDMTGGLGHDRIVAEVVHDQWLRGLDHDDVELLLRASGLEWMSGPLCDRVLGRSDSGARLDRLHRNRLLVTPLDRRGNVYRMHPLLRDVLDANFERLDGAARRDIDRTASAFFAQEGDIDRAVHHAARVGDEELIVELILRYSPEAQTRGRNTSVRRWLDQLSAARVHTDPAICLVAAVNAMGLGEIDESRAWVRLGMEASRRSYDEGTDAATHLAFLTLSSLMSVGPVGDSLGDATKAYEELPSGFWHAGASHAVGVHSSALGLDDVAAARLMEGAAEARLHGAHTIHANCRAQLAVLAGERGDWTEATTLAREARQLLRDHHLDNHPALVVVTAISAQVEALAGDPVAARADMTLTRRNLTYVSDVGAWANVQARLSLAQTCLLLSDRAGVRTLLDEAAVFLRSQPDATKSHARLKALSASLDAARGTMSVGPSSLTTAQLSVLHFLPTNLSIAEIGQRLYVSRNTAKSHVAVIYMKLGVSSRGAAVEAAREAGLLPR